MFKRLIILILLGAAFLGGYYVARLPGSPDIFSLAENTFQQVGQTGEMLANK